MDTEINLARLVTLAVLFLLASTAVQAESIMVRAESAGEVPIEGTWEFPECGPDDEYGDLDVKEFLIFTGDQVEGRVVQYESSNETCDGEGTVVESDTATVVPLDTVSDTCWDDVAPPRQDSNGNLAEHPLVSRMIYLLDDSNETEVGLFYIDDTADTWYLWRNGGDDDNGDEEDLSPGSDCLFPMSSEEPLLKVSPAVVSVTIDIKPGSESNPVNPASKGVIPVAVLGTVDFDATQIDFATVNFGPAPALPVHDGHIEDVNADGFMDKVFHFETPQTGIVCGDLEASLSGEIFGGGAFSGSDTLETVGCE